MAGLPKDRNSNQAQALLKSVAEELKLPLMQIVRQAELTAITDSQSGESMDFVRSSAHSAIELVDSYILGLEMAERQQMLPLEPVAIGSVFYDVAHKLNASAKKYGVGLDIQLSPSCELVMASPTALRAALFSLGSAFIASLAVSEDKPQVTLAAHRTPTGMAAGVYSPVAAISAEQLRRFDGGQNWMRQPLSQFSAGSSAGIFVAKSILESMSARLRTARFRKQSGLAAILPPSQQLKLV